MPVRLRSVFSANAPEDCDGVEQRPPLTNQWNDFLTRKVDVYAFAKYQILLDWLGAIEGKTALVVGSGSGEFAAMLARAGATVTAIDIAPAYVELTRKTATDFGVELRTEVARLETFPKQNRFDLVVATDVIEHIEDDAAAVRQLRELVCDDGRVVVTVPAMRWLFGYHDEVLGHFRRYDARSLSRVLSNGLGVMKIRYYGFLLIPIALVLSRWLRRPYPVGTVGGTSEGNRFVRAIVSAIFGLERRIRPPVGTSLLALCSAQVPKGIGRNRE